MSERAIADRLTEARQRAFVGREVELELFAQALGSGAFSVLHVHGPGGIGKSTLLSRFADLARERGVPLTRIDGAAIPARPEAVLAALGLATAPDAPSLGERRVILIDTYEELVAIDGWLRDTLLPALPERFVLVLAGREPPSAAWRTDAGLASIQRVRALRNLSGDESAKLLAARGVDRALAPQAHSVTHGHPLALVLVAELVRERGESSLPALTPDVVRVLLERVLRALPDPKQREALEIAALVRVTNEAVLTDLGLTPAGPLFAWLRSLSFVHESAEGAAPHDLVRDAIAADLAFRDPERDATLRARIQDRARRLVGESTGAARERAFFDALFALRSKASMRPFYDWERGHSGHARPLEAERIEVVLAEIGAHEGEASARIARYWWARQPEAFSALFDGTGRWVGTLVYLRLASIERADVESDPALAALERVARSAPPRGGESVAVVRFWIWRDGYQDVGSAAHAPHSMVVSLDWTFSAALSWVLVVVQRVDAWRAFFGALGFPEHERESFALGAHRFHVFARDLRAQPWSGVTTPAAARPLPLTEPPPQPQRVVLSQEDFGRAAREALRVACDARALDASPLVSSRMLAEWAEDERPSGAMLRELLEVACSSLEDGKDDRPRRCVELTYLRPAPTHEAAAERLGLSFSTYRRQLARGVERVVAYLWDREVRGAR